MSENSVKRTVLVGSMAYVDPAGRTRRADCGVEVDVHLEDVARFDELNVLAKPEIPATVEPTQETVATSEPDPAPKRRPGRPRKTET